MIAPAPVSTTVSTYDATLAAWYWAGDLSVVPVLLVHGLAANARVWEEVGGPLAATGRPVLAVDLRGHGGSASVPDPAAMDPILVAAYDLAWTCNRLGWSKVVVAGHSWGANVVLQLAVDLPDLVAGLVLVDGGWRPYVERFADLDTAWRTVAPPNFTGWDLQEVREVLADAHPDWSAAGVEATVANLERCPDGALRPWLTPDRHRQRIASMFTQRPRELHRQVRCRTLLLAADDPPHKSAVEAASVISDAELITFPGGEHDLHLQFPDQVAAAIGRLG